MSALEIIDCEQRSEEWFRARMGIPTASEFKTILAKGRDGGASKTRRGYLLRLAGEIITGEPQESYTNANMDRGRVMEDEARYYYAFLCKAPLSRVGFIRNGDKGCSPDSLIGNDGMLEIKTAFPHILAEILLQDAFQPEHKPQCQGQLWVAEREWIDLQVYWPKMPPFIKRAYRDEPYIKELAEAVDRFNDELAEIVHRLRQLGSPVEKAA
jgi:hypothetical protein